ncbi:AbrB/MazE/SpoVT family DNA-binding domain-containing protein [Saccharopolyspora indica]|uniref:AbrB/MazE/SpoVT family DNA-binding domain-containing protein n=1 Tax=Saccharopolyspora indica TaxID=1229659 RepID=UPI0022EA6D01|nr:AbrB/MazE/SpoVT family DNA-binding domain-containing protein [Saccharopolyspora indica]MDA3643530.1 AbrB/MazE/SpoVT family DNA-binding domain-containing protein [Saccharopolyspora indica]
MALADERGTRTEITANGQGRVTIPASIRHAVGIEPGTPLAVYVEDGRVVIETREQLGERIRRDVAATWRGRGSAVDELIADRRAAAAAEADEADESAGGRR